MSKTKPAAHSQSDFRGEPSLLSPFMQNSHPTHVAMACFTLLFTAAFDAGPHPQIHSLHIYTLTPLAQPSLHSHTLLAGGCTPSSLHCMPLPSGLHSTPGRLLSRGCMGVPLCYLEELGTLDSTKEGIGWSLDLPLQTWMYTQPLACPSSPSQCLSEGYKLYSR